MRGHNTNKKPIGLCPRIYARGTERQSIKQLNNVPSTAERQSIKQLNNVPPCIFNVPPCILTDKSIYGNVERAQVGCGHCGRREDAGRRN